MADRNVSIFDAIYSRGLLELAEEEDDTLIQAAI